VRSRESHAAQGGESSKDRDEGKEKENVRALKNFKNLALLIAPKRGRKALASGTDSHCSKRKKKKAGAKEWCERI